MTFSVQDAIVSVINTESRGKKVKVRVFGGKIVDRVIWEKVGSVVFLCSERSYQWLLDGEDCPQPVGFPEDAIVG